MRKFSIPGRYFIVHGRYLCPGVFPARGGWPWNAGNARFPEGPGRAGSLKVGSGSGGFRDGSRVGGCRDGFKAGSRGWFQRWFESWWLQGWFQGRFPGVVWGGGTGMAAGRRAGMCGRDGLGLPGAARRWEYPDKTRGGRIGLPFTCLQPARISSGAVRPCASAAC